MSDPQSITKRYDNPSRHRLSLRPGPVLPPAVRGLSFVARGLRLRWDAVRLDCRKEDFEKFMSVPEYNKQSLHGIIAEKDEQIADLKRQLNTYQICDDWKKVCETIADADKAMANLQIQLQQKDKQISEHNALFERLAEDNNKLRAQCAEKDNEIKLLHEELYGLRAQLQIAREALKFYA